VTLLAKALFAVCRKKWHGLTDVESRYYRQRYLDLIAKRGAARQTFLNAGPRSFRNCGDSSTRADI